MTFLAILSFVAVRMAFGFIGRMEEANRLGRLTGERQGDSTCRFARFLDYRRPDTEIIRAEYEGSQARLAFAQTAFPIRTSDDIDRDLGIDAEDLVV